MTTPDRALFRAFPALAGTLPIVPLVETPTPVRRLTRLEAELGCAHLTVKDDGPSAPPYGGNKPRKLEWLLGDARARGFEEVIAIGADGSNYCLAAAVHGVRHGFDVTLATIPQPPLESVRRNLRAGLGTGARYTPANSDVGLLLKIAGTMLSRALRGRRLYPTWFGGSSPLGAVGFVEAALELMEQVDAEVLPRPDIVVVPTGSTGTHAGLLVGFALHAARYGGPPPRVVGVRVTPPVMGNSRVVAGTANRCAALLRARNATVPIVGVLREEVEIRDGHFGEAYGLPSPTGETAMARMKDDVALDATYSAKAMAGLLAAGADGELKGKRVVFWGTYNTCPMDALPQGDLETLPDALRDRIE